MVHMVSYDLNGRERPSSYTAVKQVIERKAIDFRRPLYSQWFVQTNESPDAWQQALLSVMDDGDKLFVCQVRQPYQGWLPEEVWNWLNARV
jgi:hypothetical protein